MLSRTCSEGHVPPYRRAAALQTWSLFAPVDLRSRSVRSVCLVEPLLDEQTQYCTPECAAAAAVQSVVVLNHGGLVFGTEHTFFGELRQH